MKKRNTPPIKAKALRQSARPVLSTASTLDTAFFDTLQPIKNKVLNLSSDAEQWIKEYPVTAAGIALSTGVLIGRLSSGRPTRS